MVLSVGTLNFDIRQNILHVTEIHVCRSAVMLCDSQQRAATPCTCDVYLYDHRSKLHTVLLEGVHLPLPVCALDLNASGRRSG